MQLPPSQLKRPATSDGLLLVLLLLLLLLLLMLTLLLVQVLLAGDMQLAGTLHCRTPLLASSRCSRSDNDLPCSSCTSRCRLCCNILVLADAVTLSGPC
jgi:hypothetical protein